MPDSHPHVDGATSQGMRSFQGHLGDWIREQQRSDTCLAIGRPLTDHLRAGGPSELFSSKELFELLGACTMQLAAGALLGVLAAVE